MKNYSVLGRVLFALPFLAFGIITKKFMQIATMLLAVLLLIFIATIHIPGLFDPEGWRLSLIMLLKDTSLMGGSILIVSACSEHQAENSD